MRRMGKTTKYGSDRKMCDDVYALRKQAMTFIYRAKDIVESCGKTFQRVNIRIVDLSQLALHEGVMGYANMNGGCIRIPERAIGKDLHQIVFHEILHANYGIGHNDDPSSLMYHKLNNLTADEIDNQFRMFIK